MKFSVNTNCMRNEFSRSKIVETCQNAGASGIEWGLDKLETAVADVAEMHKLTTDAGLEVLSYINAGKLWKTDEIRLWSEAIASCGGKMLRVAHPWYAWDYEESLHQPETFDSLMKKSREGLERLIDVGREFDVRYVLETHSGSCAASPIAAKYLMEGLDPNHVGIIYDPANTYLEGFIRPRGAVEVMGSYLAYVHAKNITWEAAEPTDEKHQVWTYKKCGLETGLVDYKEIMFALKIANYDGWFSFEELYSGKDNFEKEICDGIAHLQKCFVAAPDMPQPPFMTIND